MNKTFTGQTINDVLPAMLKELVEYGDRITSRNGSMKEIAMARVHLINPSFNPYVTVPGRRVSLPAQIAETIWVLSGRNDIEFISPYLPRAADFSDDGVTWSGGYGPRLRNWDGNGSSGGIDQLYEVARHLSDNPESRRGVIQIFSPELDGGPVLDNGKDVPCNNWISFLIRDGKIHAQVAVRSNDVFWGFSGINAFEWTFLLQVMAYLTNTVAGSLTFSTTSLHLYARHYSRAIEIKEGRAEPRRAEREISVNHPQTIFGLKLREGSFQDRWKKFTRSLHRFTEYILSLQAGISTPENLRDELQRVERFKLFRTWANALAEFHGAEPVKTLPIGSAAFQYANLESPWRDKREVPKDLRGVQIEFRDKMIQMGMNPEAEKDLRIVKAARDAARNIHTDPSPEQVADLVRVLLNFSEAPDDLRDGFASKVEIEAMKLGGVETLNVKAEVNGEVENLVVDGSIKGMSLDDSAAARKQRFLDYVEKLHSEKNEAYGDSWMKRGETLGIMANIARKVDRLGVPGAGDAELDTATDLMLYLAKYLVFLEVKSGYVAVTQLSGDPHHERVMAMVRRMGYDASEMGTGEKLRKGLKSGFEDLAAAVEKNHPRRVKSRMAEGMLWEAVELAQREFRKDELSRLQFTGYDV